ncbi:MAG: hypothetical protein ABIJ46_00360 [bacterium]
MDRRKETEAGRDFPDLHACEWNTERPDGFDSLPFEVKPGFSPLMLERGDIVDTSYALAQVEIDGNRLVLAGRDDILRLNGHDSRAINFYFGRDGGFLEETIELDEGENDIVAEVSLVRHDARRQLPRGIGRKAFDASVEYMRRLARESGKTVIYRTDRSSVYGGEELSESDWDRMFLPL